MTTLTNKANTIWRMVKARSGVVFMQGRAGVAKSATCKSIAEAMGLQYIDLRLSYMDEVDFGMPKSTVKTINGRAVDVLSMAMPEWFEQAQAQPTLICFEELNRASQEVLNAALGVLNERTLHNHKFNDNVYMIATGNIGMEDGTSVNDIEAAMRNRLMFYRFNLTLAEWKQAFADEHVNKELLRYLEEVPSAFMCSQEGIPNDGQYNTPRSWTFLSDFINANGGDAFNMLNELEDVAACYVGAAAASNFITWLRDNERKTLKDALAGKVTGKDVDRATAQAILHEWGLQYPDDSYMDLEDDVFQNWVNFVRDLPVEMLAAFIIDFEMTFVPTTKESEQLQRMRVLLKDKKVSKVYEQVKKEAKEVA